VRQLGWPTPRIGSPALILWLEINFRLDRQSNGLCDADAMKNKRTHQTPLHALVFQPITIARFGPARLIKHFDGPYELIGGTPADQAAAREWCSMFAPGVVFSGTPRSKPVVAFAV